MMDQTIKEETITHRDPNSSSQGFDNRRLHVRVLYPSACPVKFLPDLVVNHRACLVLDISEGGIRFAISNSALVKNGPIAVLLRFPDRVNLEITGEVVRRNYNQVALKLEKGIPYTRIMSEQVRLRNLEANGVITLPYSTRR